MRKPIKTQARLKSSKVEALNLIHIRVRFRTNIRAVCAPRCTHQTKYSSSVSKSYSFHHSLVVGKGPPCIYRFKSARRVFSPS